MDRRIILNLILRNRLRTWARLGMAQDGGPMFFCRGGDEQEDGQIPCSYTRDEVQ